MYLFFTKNNNNKINKNNTDKDKQKTEIDNYDFLLNTETNWMKHWYIMSKKKVEHMFKYVLMLIIF